MLRHLPRDHDERERVSADMFHGLETNLLVIRHTSLTNHCHTRQNFVLSDPRSVT